MRNSGTRVAVRLIALVVAFIVSIPGSANAGPRKIVFYDPDANHQAIVNITAWFNQYLQSSGLDVRFQPVQDRPALEKLLNDPDTVFAIVPSSLLRSRRTPSFSPLLVPSASGSVYYRKQLLTKGSSSTVSGKAIAATLPSDARDGGTRILSVLRQNGVADRGVSIIPVSKDIDALLALAYGQVQAALVTPDSVEVLKRINPGAVASFKTLYETRPILRSPLCGVNGKATAEEKTRLLEVLRNMNSHGEGRKAMNTLGFDQWVPFRAGMLKS